jgi:HAE1 family hydrophobic/amphiphilic exporter-1
VENVGAIAGDNDIGSMLGFGGASSGSQEGEQQSSLYIMLGEEMQSTVIGDEILEKTKDIGAEIRVSSASTMDMSALGGSGITINLYSDDMDDLMAAAESVASAAEGVSGVDEVENPVQDANAEYTFTVDKEKAVEKGLTVAQVYQKVAAALSEGTAAGSIDIDGKSYDIKLNFGEETDKTPEYVKDLVFRVQKQDGTYEKVKLSEVAKVTESKSLPSIQRQDQRRYLSVTAQTDGSRSVTLISADLDKAIAAVDLPDSVTMEVTGETTTIFEALGQLGWMLIVGLLLVYLVMVAQFQSLKNPFIIMFTIPLAFTGGFFALLITGMDVSVISLFGFVMLVGIIVNNGIVLIDYINQLRMDGMEKMQAIREGGRARMRPIFMTAFTTVLGLIVTALGTSSGSEMMQPLAVVCIGGLLYATLMTLIVIPVIYDAFNKKELRVITENELTVDYDA